MDPVKLGERQKKRRAEQMSQLKEIKAEMKKFQAKRSLTAANVTDGAPNKLEELRPFLAEVTQEEKAVLREAFKGKSRPIYMRHKQIIRSNYAAVSLPAFSEDGEEKEAKTSP